MRQLGKYRLVEPLATGGMAEVWRAEVTGAEGVVKDVALKLVRGEYEADSAFVRMFIQEARLAMRLGHANVVQVFEFDQIDGRYYIAMELVRGRHLGQVVERARERGVRIGIPRAVQIGAEVARALAYAHRLADGGRPLGLVHRDVSPHNVLVSFEGEVKLADFGIARALNLAEATAPGTVKGKAAYMAPEQARGAAVDARADVFALGVVLWELCAGRRLFARESEAATLGAVLDPQSVSPPSAWNEDMPPDLDAAIVGALEKDPAKRTRSAQELATSLAEVLLRVTRSPADVDLRELMHRLFGDEAAPAARRGEPTCVRPVPIAAEPAAHVAEPTRRAPMPDESVTRTAVVARARRSSRSLALLAGGAVAAGVAVSVLVLRPPAFQARSRAAAAALATPTARTLGPASPAPAPAPAAPPAMQGSSAPAPARPAPPAGGPHPAATPGSTPRAASVPRAARPSAAAPGFFGLPVPDASTGDGILGVSSTPWGRVSVDGLDTCDSPCAVRLRAGRHRVVVTNGALGMSARQDVSVLAGRRSALVPTLLPR